MPDTVAPVLLNAQHDFGGVAGDLPADLLSQIRKRVGILALLLLLAIASELLIAGATVLNAWLTDAPAPA